MRLPTALVAALSLVLGFAVAQVTDLRWAGGVVVLAGAGWCVARERRRTAWWRLVLVLLVGAAAFVISHLLAGALGAWGAVLVAAAVLGGATHLLVGRGAPGSPGAPAARTGRATLTSGDEAPHP
ncbi:hypothetical protein J4G33_06530 [Actinotalea sp. BY-33]|uniref:Uncharacterized protein n=1 Tax=Actinotalea soli TaxID=2819234 RepID=A0A939LUC3_9CELL|nr:hypothetical protein [Actinotalea soli]MBO1751457.1 hypothetical protein [Actinotalea soli]